MSIGIKWNHICLGPIVAIKVMTVMISGTYNTRAWKSIQPLHQAFNWEAALFASPFNITNISSKSSYEAEIRLPEPAMREGWGAGESDLKISGYYNCTAHIVTLRGKKEPALLSACSNWLWKIQSRLLFGSHLFIRAPKWDGAELERQRPPLASKPSFYTDITQAFGFWTQTHSKQRQSLWLSQGK